MQGFVQTFFYMSKVFQTQVGKHMPSNCYHFSRKQLGLKSQPPTKSVSCTMTQLCFISFSRQLCFISFSRATDIARSFRLKVQLHRLIHIGKLSKFFTKLLFKSNNLCGSGRIFALPLSHPWSGSHADIVSKEGIKGLDMMVNFCISNVRCVRHYHYCKQIVSVSCSNRKIAPAEQQCVCFMMQNRHCLRQGFPTFL